MGTRVVLGLVIVVAVAGCGNASPPEALMTAGDLRAHPWPSDALLGADGRIAVTPPFPFDGDEVYLSRLAQSLSEVDGFSTVTSVFFSVSEPVVVESGATAQIVDLDGDDPPRSFPLFYRAATRQLVAMSPPGTVLREQHHYGCVVASGVHDGAGRALRPSPAMADALRPGAAAPPSYALLAQRLTSPAEAATAFTTRSVSDWVAKPLGDLQAMPPKAHLTRLFQPGPDLDALFGGPITTTRPGRPPSGGLLHGHVGLVVEGTFGSPNYLAATPATFGLFDAGPTIKSVEDIPFMLILPQAPAAGVAVPVAIYQHGLNGDRSTMLQVADDFAARGYAILGIDALWHGSRQPGAVDVVYNAGGAPGSDGIGDPKGIPVASFFDFSGDPATGVAPLDARIIRDNFRQATIDLIQTVRLAQIGDWSEVAGVSLDGSRLVYTAASFGSILGANVMAVDPTVPAAVLAVPGAGLFVDLVGNSATFGPLLQSMLMTSIDRGIDVGHPDVNPMRAQMSLALLQTVLDPGDGLALAGRASTDQNVLFLEAFNDEVVPNHATESLATAWGATQVMVAGSPPTRVVSLPEMPPPYASTPVRALVQLAPACHSMFTTQVEMRTFEDGGPPFVQRSAPLEVDNPVERAHALALDFMDSFRQGAATVRDSP
jgi:hypothetical protein